MKTRPEDAEGRDRWLMMAALIRALEKLHSGQDIETVLRELGDAVRAWKASPAPAPAAEPETGHEVVVLGSPGTSLTQTHSPTPTIASARKLDPSDAICRRVFAHWTRELDHSGAKPTVERITKIRARLRDGYTESDMIAAIDGCANSPFHRGENDSATKYDDLTLILRNGSNLEKFKEKAPKSFGGYETPESVGETPEDAERLAQAAALQRQAKAALKSGNVEEYNELLRSVRALRSKPG